MPKICCSNMALTSYILDTIRDSLRLHVGFCLWSDDICNLFWVVSARDNDGERWICRHEDFYLAVCGLAQLVGFELEDG